MDKRPNGKGLFWIGVGASLLAIILWDVYKMKTRSFNYDNKNIRL